MGPEVGHYVKAVYDFAAQESRELSLQVGDIVKITDVIDGSWLQGEAIHGAQGSFPSNFVEPLVLPDARMGQRVFVAVVDFPSEQSGDLELTKGDIILGTEQVDDNWWKGKIGPLRGIFPLSCVQELEITLEGPRSRSASLRGRSASLKARADSLAKTPEAVFARALVDVVPQIEGELGFQIGDLITVTEVVDNDWFYGECHNKVGLVSTICVEFLDDPEDDSESSAGHSILDSSADSERDSLVERGGGRNSLPLSNRKQGQDVEEKEAHAPSKFVHSDKNLPPHSVSYTSENTRSHDAEITPYAKTLYAFQAQLPTELSFGDNEIVTLIQHIDEDWIEGELDGKIGLFPATFVEIIVDCPYAYSTSSTVSPPKHLGEFSGTEHDICNKSISAAESDDLKNSQRKESVEQTVEQNGHCSGSSSASQASSQVLPSSEGKKNTNCQEEAPSVVASVSDSRLALVLHSFQGEVQGDLTVKEGDTIEVLRNVDSDWLEARNDQGIVGLVPKNHVQVISDAPQEIPNKSSKPEESASHQNSTVDHAPAPNSQISSEKRISGEAIPSEVPFSSVQSSTGSNNQGSVTSTVFNTSAPDSTQGNSGQSDNQTVSHDHHHQNEKYRQGASAKPTPLPKPKLAPKPVIKPKPHLGPKPFVPSHGTDRELSTRHVVSPTEKQAASIAKADNGSDSGTGDKNVFSGVNVGLSLDNLVQVELEKAKSEGERSRGSSIVEEEKQSRSESFSSVVSDEQSTLSTTPKSQRNSGNYGSARTSLDKSEEASTSQNKKMEAETSSFSADKSQDHFVAQSSVENSEISLKTGQNGTRPVSSADLQTLLPPSPQFNRSSSDSGFPAATPKRSEAKPTPRSSHRHSISMPPARPIPPTPKVENKRHSFVNPGFVHESEGQLISLDVTNASRPPPPARAVPMPPQQQDLLGDVERRVKRPPPRPTGPRIASVPPRTPLQPMRADGSKPIPHRPAPPAPGNRRSAPVAPGSVPLSEATPSKIPPRPVSVAGSTPPKRPPPRLQKSPNDLMRFSPEPVSVIDEAAEDNEELVADLKKRLQENKNDIHKYEQSKQDLGKKLAELDESERLETEESLQFVEQTLQGLKEEEKRLKGNLFSISPREERLEKAKLLAEQQATDERLRREEEEKQSAEQRAKNREKRQKVLQELVDTEKDYLFDLQLCLATFFDSDSAIKVPFCVDIDFLFGNMEEIADVSQRLLTSLESATSGKAFQDQIIGSTFVALAEDMKNTYAPYCRHHDDVIAVMEKHREIPEACQYFAAKVEEMRRRTNIFDVEAVLIKPVQRILKYPLLLSELNKCTENDHPDRVAITTAIQAMTNVAKAINEYKRRKDLVFKYKRDSDQSFAMKIAKLNFHSIKKKSSRMRGRLTTNLGIGLQLRDEKFEQEETRFRSAEKAVKVLLRNIMYYMDQMQEVVSAQENLAADISDYYGDKTCEEVSRYLTVHRELLSHHKTLSDTVEELVLIPLNKLVAMLNGPNNVIDKRFDKLLDYNNLLGRGKDEKLVQAAKNDYEAMNAQLLDELPKLYQLTMTLTKHCMAAYVRAQRDFMDHALKENCILLELPSLLGGGENVMEHFNIRHTAALDQISMLSFIPRGFNPKMDSFRLDRRSSSRLSFDTSKPPPTIQSSSQSDSQRTYLRQMYGADNLYQATQTMPAHDLMDMAITVGTLVAVIKDKDPMGGRQRWFVDDGANKGFVQSSILVKASPASPTGSLSSLNADDMDEIASQCSVGTEEGENLPWLAGQSPPQYPSMTEVSPPQPPAPHLGQPAYEYYSAEYPFQARSSNEVTLFAGQVVVVLSHHDLDGNSEWWLVDADGYQGYAPANYLRKM